MHSAERRAQVLSLGVTLALLGCTRSEPAVKALPPLLSPTHYLDEPFTLGVAQCHLVSAAPMLTEAIVQAHAPGGASVSESQQLAADDVSVVELSFACEDAGGTPVPFSSLSARLAWLDRTRTSHAPTTTTRLGQKQPEHAVFEVPSGQDGLLRTRRYDAKTGAPLGRHEPGSARLYLEPREGAQARVVVAPWPRLHDEALDALLDRLARTLASQVPDDGLSETEAGHAAIATVRQLYLRTRERFAPTVLSLRAIANVEGQPRLTLSLGSGTRDGDVVPSASFSLELAQGTRGLPTVVRLLDPEGTRSVIECAMQSADLLARVERARTEGARRASEGTEPDAQCNALGVLVPHSCALADANLVHAALRVQTRCGPSGALNLNVRETSGAPSDFEVKLRRGRTSESLDGGPRYSVSLSHSGQVHFEGLHQVSARGPSEGRTSQVLLAALWGHMARLGWSEREPESGKRCADGDQGDVITVLANGRTLTVRDRAGCRAGFGSDELTGLARAIERVAAVDAWTTPGLPVFSRDAEIWIVAAE